MTESAVFHETSDDSYRDASGPLTISGGGGPPTGAAGGVLSGTYPNPGFAADMATQAELDAHTGDTTDAHDASAISVDSTTLVGTGTDVQASLEELDNGIADHLADTTAAHAASAISFSPTGTIASTDVQAAIAEVASEATGGGAPTGSAGGVLDGTYPNPGLAASVAGAGLAETADVLSVNVDGSTLEISTDTLRIKDGGVTAAKVAADVATQAELDAHTGDTSAAHAASAISADSTTLVGVGTDVQAVLEEIDDAVATLVAASGIPVSTIDAKGDLLVGSANDAIDNLAVGANNTVLTPDSAQTLGVKWSAAPLGGVGWTVITKSGDESVTNSTLQDDNDFFFTAVSGGVYEFEAILVYASPAGAGTPDMKVLFFEDATVRGQFQGWVLTTADAASTGQSGTASGATALAMGTAAANRVGRINGQHVGNGGTFKMQWAQNTTNANATILRQGSVFRYRRIL